MSVPDPLHPLPDPASSEATRSTITYSVAPGGLLRTLVDGVRACLLMPAGHEDHPARASHAWLIWLATALVSIVGDAWMLGSEAVEFNWAAIRGFAFEPWVWVIVSIWVTSPARQPVDSTGTDTPGPLQLASPLLAANFWITLGSYLLVQAIGEGWLDHIPWIARTGADDVAGPVFLLTQLWIVLIALLVLRRLRRSATRSPRSSGLAWIALLITALFTYLQPPEPFWTQPEDESDEAQETSLSPHGARVQGENALRAVHERCPHVRPQTPCRGS